LPIKLVAAGQRGAEKPRHILRADCTAKLIYGMNLTLDNEPGTVAAAVGAGPSQGSENQSDHFLVSPTLPGTDSPS
jgi:hypothetical protein